MDARTSGSRADRAMERGAGKSQKDPGQSSVTRKREGGQRTQSRMTLFKEIAKFQVAKRSTKVALRGNPRGVSSNHVLLWAFGDAS